MEKIRILRQEKGISQQALAKMLGLSQKSIDNWERGTASPSATSVAKLADFFECSTDYLLDRENDLGQIIVNNDLNENQKKILFYYDKCGKQAKKTLLLFSEFLAEKEIDFDEKK